MFVVVTFCINKFSIAKKHKNMFILDIDCVLMEMYVYMYIYMRACARTHTHYF